MGERVYRGRWLPDGQTEVTVNGLPLRQVPWHGRSGFAWGYGGSGPADLALSILADFLVERPTLQQVREGRCRCWRFHQDFKWAFIAPLDQAAGWTILGSEIRVWMQARKKRRRGAAGPTRGRARP